MNKVMTTHGDVFMAIDNHRVMVRFDWRAIGRLIAEIGPDFDQQIAEASAGYNAPVIAQVLTIGLEHGQPGQFPFEKIMDLSPPLMNAIEAINNGMMVAFYGSTDVPDPDEKKTPIRTMIVRMVKRMLMI